MVTRVTLARALTLRAPKTVKLWLVTCLLNAVLWLGAHNTRCLSSDAVAASVALNRYGRSLCSCPSWSTNWSAHDGREHACACGRFERVVKGVDQGRATIFARPCSDFARDGFCSCAADEAVNNRGETKNVQGRVVICVCLEREE